MAQQSIGKILLIALLAITLASTCVLTSCAACTSCSPPPDGPDDPINGEDPNSGNNGIDLPVVEIPAVNMISPVALKELMQNQSCRVFDTRTYPEYSSGSVPGALNLPLRFVERRQAEIPRNRMVVFLASDARELSQLYGLLIELGFDPANIRMLEGGIAAWKAAGFEVEEHDIPWC